MTAITIIISTLTAVAAIFAVLFFQDRKDAKKYESKAESLSKELNDLRCDLARRENNGGDAMVPNYPLFLFFRCLPFLKNRLYNLSYYRNLI